jgi:hypothetical protein
MKFSTYRGFSRVIVGATSSIISIVLIAEALFPEPSVTT